MSWSAAVGALAPTAKELQFVINLTLTLFQRWVTEPALEQMDNIIVALEQV